MRVNLTTALALCAVVGAGAFAAGRSFAPSEPTPLQTSAAPIAAVSTGLDQPEEALPPGHPPTDNQALPPGHPNIDGVGGSTPPPSEGASEPASSPLVWKAPARWQSVPNPSSMRLATYRVPRAPGDSEDADLSITQAGGSVDANAARWIGQFDAAGQKTAKRSTRTVGPLAVTIVEVEGNYTDSMGVKPQGGAERALLGAIVETPGMPHFFKLTGPAKTVLSARAEFDAMISGLAQR